jgi:hypothetical protein
MDLALYLSRRSKDELLLGTSLLGGRPRGHMRVLRRRRNIIGDW